MVTQTRNIITAVGNLAGVIGRSIPAGLHPSRGPRVCARRVKSPLSPLEQTPARQAPHQLADHRHHPEIHNRTPARSDTPPVVRDNYQRTLTPALGAS
jgi:hypothetical protein